MNFKDIKKLTRMPDMGESLRIDFLERRIEWYEEDYDLELNPDFQRGHVWSEEQQVSFMEYLLRGGQSGRDIYFNCPGYRGGYEIPGEMNQMVCVDGLQRLTAVRRFLNGEIKAFGLYRDEFEGNIAPYDLLIHVNDLKTRKEVLQWYLEMNSTGVVHSEDELDRVRDLLKKEM